MKNRDVSLDFLRGLAVIFMIMQHLAVWLWDAGWSKSMSLFSEAPIYLVLIAFSAVSAPIFIFCAGVGSYLFMHHYNSSSKIMRRGILLLCAGYLTVITIDSWFSWGSWYVLQLIGFCFLTVPLLAKIKRKSLIFLFIIIAVLSVIGQYLLQTPLAYGNMRMADLSLSFAPLRLALFEGHFPVFPWWGIFILGYFFGYSVQRGEYASLIKPSFVFAAAGLILVLVYHFAPGIEDNGLLAYIFSYKVRFYPLLLPVLLLLCAASCISLYLIHAFCVKFSVDQKNPITAIGRMALTAFITHIYIKEFVYTFDLVQEFTKWQTIGFTVFLLGLYAGLSLWLRKYNYRFTFEWLFRKFG